MPYTRATECDSASFQTFQKKSDGSFGLHNGVLGFK